VDVGLYYRAPLDMPALRSAAGDLDHGHRGDAVTDPGGWGAWVNGGAWLHIEGVPVDLIYRDLGRVERCVEEAQLGRFETAYHWGHPHGFVSVIYAAEVARCQVLADPSDALGPLKARLNPYPEPLREALVRQFGGEATFTVFVARHSLPRGDVAYTAGCCYRAIASLMQALHAHNRTYLLNEKGAVASAARLPDTLPDLESQVAAAFALLRPEPSALAEAVEAVAWLVAEGQVLMDERLQR
jgi:hypothetical protein